LSRALLTAAVLVCFLTWSIVLGYRRDRLTNHGPPVMNATQGRSDEMG
jgi:hypothetical protein